MNRGHIKFLPRNFDGQWARRSPFHVSKCLSSTVLEREREREREREIAYRDEEPDQIISHLVAISVNQVHSCSCSLSPLIIHIQPSSQPPIHPTSHPPPSPSPQPLQPYPHRLPCSTHLTLRILRTHRRTPYPQQSAFKIQIHLKKRKNPRSKRKSNIPATQPIAPL
jgi:hypothetical protein